MAVRSSSGTGVIVPLVVFVLCTVFLLVLTIVFYSGKTKADQLSAQSEATLAKYVTREQRNRDEIKALEEAANPARGDSVVLQLQRQQLDLMGYLYGDPGAELANVRGEYAKRFKIPEDSSINAYLNDVTRDLRSRETELQGLTQRLTDRDQEIAELEARMKTAHEAHEEELDAVRRQVDTYRDAVERYRAEVQEVKGEYYGAVDRYRDDYESRILELENEKDRLHQDRAQLRARVDELREALNEGRMRPRDPSELVDGRIIETAGSRDQVFIDLGREDRISLGMTFEVYDDAAALQQVDQLTGDLPRGKASLEVIKVGQTTSTCKITRAIRGRPVVRQDVIANAVYDPDYTFKFLVHGKFDVDGDGRPTEAEADYLRSVIIDWGGAVVSAEELPGDLDFLVLGVEPPKPLPPPTSVTATGLKIWQDKRLAYEKYQDLFRQAREAQIPVMNANRFFILIGHTDR